MPDSHLRALKALERRGRLRQLAPRQGIDFSSNDYLALGAATELRAAIAEALERGVAVGAGGSRLLRGNDEEHEALEAEAAQHFRSPSALFMGSGFLANYAIFSTLPGRDDLVLFDELIHASVRDGVRAAKADHRAFRHNDAGWIEDAIRDWRTSGGRGTTWIAVESLYSMDGDRAPLDELMAVADRHGCMLVIDEAHATGVYGPDGRGLAAHLEGRDNVLSLHTCGKALGVMGALVLGPAHLKTFLLNRGRPFIYATAPSPLLAAAVRSALAICRREPQRRSQLALLVAHAGRELADRAGLAVSGSQIQPVIVGQDEPATRLAAAMQARGFDIRAVRPPTVPEGSARLRISLTLNATAADVTSMVGALIEEMETRKA